MLDKLAKDLGNAKVLLFFGAIIWSTTVVGMDFYFVSEDEFNESNIERLIDRIADTKIKAKYAKGKQKEMFEELLIRYEAKLEKIKDKK